MPSIYDQNNLNEADQAKIQSYQDEYNRIKNEAIASGIAENQLGQHQGIMDKLNAAHSAAEAVRNGAVSGGYSGGVDGGGYERLPKDTVPNTNIAAPTAKDDYIHTWSNAQQEAALAALKSAYDQNVIDTDAYAAKIPGIYQGARNQTSATAEQNRAGFNEMAAASGLNSGAGGQADLSMRNQNMANMSGINAQEAQAENDLETTRLKISTQYQNDIAQAIAEGNLQKAQMLYNEHVRVDEGLVAQSMAQADENYRYWAANNQISQQQQAAQLQQAENMAAYGIFSGYASIPGYTPEIIAQMENMWRQNNPLMARSMGSFSGGNGGKGYIPASPQDKDIDSGSNDGSTGNGKYSDGYMTDAGGNITKVYVRGMGMLPIRMAEQYIDQRQIVQNRDANGKIYFVKR